MGNRGCIHDGTDIVRRWATKRWIICALDYKGWVAPRWAPGRWTALFFHDEYVALAAGHRPCALCRRADYRAYLAAVGETRADGVDGRLHRERLRLHRSPWNDLPDGTFVDLEGVPARVSADKVVTWDSVKGYGGSSERPRGGDALVITPPTNVTALRNGYAVT
jgi:hypothetical protein